MARSDDYPLLIEALCDAIAAAWPEVLATYDPPGGGIWEVTEGKRIAYEAVGSNIDGEFRPFPRAVLEIPPAHEANWGMTNTVYEQPIVAYYADFTTGGKSAPFRSRLAALRHEIQANGLTTEDGEFTVLPRWGEQVYNSQQRWDQSMNDILMVRNNMAQAGGLLMTVLVGDTPD